MENEMKNLSMSHLMALRDLGNARMKELKEEVSGLDEHLKSVNGEITRRTDELREKDHEHTFKHFISGCVCVVCGDSQKYDT